MCEMAPPTTFTYFNTKGLGEQVRLLLAYGRIPFVDRRLEREQFIPIKSDYPFGKLPVLEIDGKILHQSTVMCRYLAAKMGLTGADAWQAIECDMIADTISDLMNVLETFYFEKDEKVKDAKRQNALDNVFPLYFSRLDAMVMENGGFLVGNQLTWVDIVLSSFSDHFTFATGVDLIGARPALKALREKVMALPGIKEYVDNRPHTHY